MSTHNSDDAVVRLRGLTKDFGATRALDGAELALRRGTVHALLGGNGSGKSTAIKVLAGVYEADGGVIQIGRAEWSPEVYSAAAGRAAGLRFVHQDLGLFGPLSIAENFALDSGYPLHGGRGVRWGALRSRVAALLDRFEIDASPDTPVAALRPAQRTMVAIARALQDESDDLVLVLDEPTATLPAHESEVLLQAIRRRADLGQTIMMVSHRMQEVLSVAHDFTVFRDGRTVAHLVDATPTEDELIGHMTGRELSRTMEHQSAAETASRVHSDQAPLLEVSGLVGGPLRGVTLSVRAGEIVGVTGLIGSGRTSLLKTVFGDHRPAGGSITIEGRVQSGREDIAQRMAQGVAYVAEDRVGESSFLDLTVRENLSASVLRSFWGVLGMDRAAERTSARELIRRHAVKTASDESVFSQLSGGNQQKAILGRWLRRSPRVLLLDEPTQGVDIMSRKDIYDTVGDSAAAGCAVLVASSDFMELVSLCDRVLVLRDGLVATELWGAQLTPDHLTAATQSSLLTPGAPS
ncbi:sugar ABC transporter ATP-binding protein [Actinomycetota bacterium]